MIDHLTVTVKDMGASRPFFEKTLGALGYSVKMDFGMMVGFGDARKPYFWLKQAETITTPQHIAFVAKDRAAVDAFHQAAVEAGAKDDGAPGIRHDYHPNYYASFVIDPFSGHPIEAVCHTEPAKPKAAKKKPAAKKVTAKKKKR